MKGNANLRLRSHVLRRYYGKYPFLYDITFIHYQIKMPKGWLAQRQLKKDFLDIRKITGSSFLVYFSDVKSYAKMKQGLWKEFGNDCYVRICNLQDHEKYRQINRRAHILVTKQALEEMNLVDEKVVLRINTVAELSIKQFRELQERYSIEAVMVGQIAYYDKQEQHLVEELKRMYPEAEPIQLELEKIHKITNDIYDVETYTRVINALEDMAEGLAELPTEQKVKAIVEKLSDNLEYDDDDREDVKIENHNLIGPIFYKKSVCEGNAKLVQQLCSMLGIEAQVVTGYRYGGGHVWNEVRVNGEWMEVDVTREIYEKQCK